MLHVDLELSKSDPSLDITNKLDNIKKKINIKIFKILLIIF